MTEPDGAFRKAYQAVLDRTPPAPEWGQLAVPAAPAAPPRRRSLPRWLPAAAAAMLLVAVVAGASLFSFDGAGTAPGTDATGASPPEAPGAAAESPGESPADAPVPADPVRLDVAKVVASSELAEFEARYLIDGTERAWNDASAGGQGARLTFEFGAPVELAEVVIRNMDDPERFTRNFKIHTFELLGVGNGPVSLVMPATPGEHRFEVSGTAATVELVVTGVHPAEAFAGSPPFEELAVAEVEFYGTPAGEPAPPQAAGGTRLRQAVAAGDWKRYGVPVSLAEKLVDVAWTGTAFVAVGTAPGGLPASWISPDGVVWSGPHLAGEAPTVLGKLAVTADYLFAVGHQADQPAPRQVFRSPDGVRWEHATPPSGNVAGVAAGPTGGYIAVGWVGDPEAVTKTSTPAVWFSADGLEWNAVHEQLAPADMGLPAAGALTDVVAFDGAIWAAGSIGQDEDYRPMVWRALAPNGWEPMPDGVDGMGGVLRLIGGVDGLVAVPASERYAPGRMTTDGDVWWLANVSLPTGVAGRFTEGDVGGGVLVLVGETVRDGAEQAGMWVSVEADAPDSPPVGSGVAPAGSVAVAGATDGTRAVVVGRVQVAAGDEGFPAVWLWGG